MSQVMLIIICIIPVYNDSNYNFHIPKAVVQSFDQYIKFYNPFFSVSYKHRKKVHDVTVKLILVAVKQLDANEQVNVR